jgi:hypothetical protein
LRSHKNRWDHADLDRHLGASFLRHILYGERPWVPAAVEDRLLDLLSTDLKDRGETVLRTAAGELSLPDYGDRSIIISHPLIREQPGSQRAYARARRASDRYLDQLLVDRAHPAAIIQALDASSGMANDDPPFEWADEGVPVYRSLGALAGSGSDLPKTIDYADIRDAPDGSFIVRLDAETMENAKLGETRPFARGTWHLFTRVDGPTKAPMLARRTDGKSFQASSCAVTFGLVGASIKDSGLERHRIVYASLRPTARAEQINANAIEFLGAFQKVLGV